MSVNDASPYPRDFRGYGGNPPDPKWPGSARVAVSLVVNVEAGSELSLADGDERNESVYEIVEPGDKIASEHIYWDHASVLVQLGVLDAKRVPALGGEQAQRLLDPDAVANRLMEEWMP